MNRFGCPPVVAPFYWQPTRDGLKGLGVSTTTGAAAGASTGAAIGSVVPIVGSAVGAILGAVGGAIASAFTRSDPEQKNFDQAVAQWQVNPNSVYLIANKYLPLAGLFDLKKVGGNIPIYKKYGRMGEQRFVNDLVSEVYSAAQQGRITAGDTPLTIMSRIVQPWIDNWGYGPMVDTHADLIQKLIVGMIADYVAGLQGNWHAVGGDFPFANLPRFALPSAAPSAPPPVVAAPTINPVGSPALPPIVSAPAQQSAPVPAPAAAPAAPAVSAPAITPVGSAPAAPAVPATIPQVNQPSSATVATTSGGQQVTQADLQALIAQLAAQGQSAQQAYNNALQTLQNNGVQATPQVQAAVQSAVQATPAPATAGISSSSAPGWAVAAGVLAIIFATARPAKTPRRRRRSKAVA